MEANRPKLTDQSLNERQSAYFFALIAAWAAANRAIGTR